MADALLMESIEVEGERVRAYGAALLLGDISAVSLGMRLAMDLAARPAAHPVQVTTIEALKTLPVGSVLRHPKGSLVEIVTWDLRPNEPIPRIGTYNQNWESLYADWDFPMDLLYRPETSRG